VDLKSWHRKKNCLYYRKQQLKRCCDKQLVHITVIIRKFDIKNIHPKYIKVYTDIDPTVDFVFPVNKIDRENSEKIVS
jgi:hypothetical protein